MRWSDKAIILSTSKYGENSAIITAFSYQHGINKGLVRSIQGKKNRSVFQTGNIVNIEWRGKLQENLGNFTAETEKHIFPLVINNNIKLFGLLSLTSMLETMLQEKETHKSLYLYSLNLLLQIEENVLSWLAKYIIFEIQLLSEIGFGIDTQKCAVCNISEDLIYISPKSGRAVCKEHGMPYHDKLIKLPCFIRSKEYINVDLEEIKNAFSVCNYFFNKYIVKPKYLKMPEARSRFINIIIK